MGILLLTGLLLIGLASVLVMRSIALARVRQRETLAQIASYGFRSPAPTVRTARSFRGFVHAAASAAGGRLLARFDTERARRVRRQLDAAGLYHVPVETFLGYRVLAVAAPAIGILALAMASGSLGPKFVVVALWVGLFAFLLPVYLVKRRARLRLDQVEREVPELVDLLVTTVEAGVGFAGGLQLAARSIRGPPGAELRHALQEQSLGLTPEQALRNLARRVDSPALRAFSQALIQGEALGVSIGKVMRDLAIDMRKRRRQSAEERAQKTPTKILFPLVTLILPATFILVLGPVVVRVVEYFGGA